MPAGLTPAALGPAAPRAHGPKLDDMSVPRWSFTALELLDGRVFVIDHEACNGMSDLTGPPHAPGRTDILEPATGRWTAAAALNATRSGFVDPISAPGQCRPVVGDLEFRDLLRTPHR